jgi:hypothetical protein
MRTDPPSTVAVPHAPAAPRPGTGPLTAALAAVTLVVGGCYGAAPPPPTRVPVPALVPGVPIAVRSETTTAFETVTKKSVTCPQGHIEGSPSCLVTTYQVREPVTRTATTAAYGDLPLSYAQFLILTNPQRDAQLAELRHRSHVCSLANVPRWIGITLVVGGLVVMGVGAAKNIPAATYGGVGGIGGGLASYGLGYFAFGGNQCGPARALYRELEVGDVATKTTVYGEVTAQQMKELADRFNAMRAARPAEE